jgi:hypothetical protein
MCAQKAHNFSVKKILFITVSLFLLLTVLFYAAIYVLKGRRYSLSTLNTIYKCTDFAFSKTCENNKCIDSKSEEELFSIWKDEFMKINNLNNQDFNDRVVISDVWIPEATALTGYEVVINYQLKSGWLRIAEGVSINFADFPFTRKLTEDEIRKNVRDTTKKTDIWSHPIITSNEIEAVMTKKFNGKVLNYHCNTLYDYKKIKPIIIGKYYFYDEDPANDSCYIREVDLFTGTVSDSIHDPCEKY